MGDATSPGRKSEFGFSAFFASHFSKNGSKQAAILERGPVSAGAVHRLLTGERRVTGRAVPGVLLRSIKLSASCRGLRSK